jgi:phosphoribosylamine--glycine ligase
MKTDGINILIIGRGSREQALAYVLEDDPYVDHVYCAPGNTGPYGKAVPDLEESDFLGILHFVIKKKIGFVIIGSERELEAGLVDYLAGHQIAAFGPPKLQAQIETSKLFCNELCFIRDIPKAPFKIAESKPEAKRIIDDWWPRVVIKFDGLKDGKGVTVPDIKTAALTAACEVLDEDPFVIIEQFIDGEEFSLIAFCDGENAKLVPRAAQDHKRRYPPGKHKENPNTGGMGVISPVPFISYSEIDLVHRKFFLPTLRGMESLGLPYRGLLYGGFIKTPAGEIKLIEWNARFPNPEWSAFAPCITSNLLPYMIATLTHGGLSELPPIKMSNDVALCRVLVDAGYPDHVIPGSPITGLSIAMKHAHIFQGGTRKVGRQTVVNGGRVVDVVGVAETFALAREQVRIATNLIEFARKDCREDIGQNLP